MKSYKKYYCVDHIMNTFSLDFQHFADAYALYSICILFILSVFLVDFVGKVVKMFVAFSVKFVGHEKEASVIPVYSPLCDIGTTD